MRLIYLSPVPWHSFSQRPHELVRYFHSKFKEPVLWLDPYPTRFPVLADLSKRPSRDETRYATPEWLTVVKPWALPIEPLPLSGWVNRLLWRDVIARVSRFAEEPAILGVGKPSALALQLLSRPIFASSFYDGMDDFSEFYKGWSRHSMAHRERKTAQAVTAVLTSSTALEKRFSQLSRDVRLLHNACASDKFATRRRAQQPPPHRAPVFGYLGTIAQWFDWELVIACAAILPLAEFRLIGPVYGRVPVSLPSNIRLYPELPHADALKAMAQFDVGLIPFKLNDLTHSVDPIKYYEYRALGLPVISTDFGEMARRRDSAGVYLIDRDSDLPDVFSRALIFAEPDESTALFRKQNSWESRFEQANVFAV